MKKPILIIVAICLLSSSTQKKLTWTAIGDSITYLNEHADETGNRITKGYLTGVTEKLNNIQYTNQGHNGWTSGDIANDIGNLGLIKSDIYSIFLGTNDWWQGRPIGRFSDYLDGKGNKTVYGSYKIIIDKLRGLNKEAKIILITPLQRADFVYINDMKNNAYGSYKEKNGQPLAQFAKAIDSIATYEHFELVDLYNKSGITLENMVKYKHLKDPATGQYKNYNYPAYTTIPFNPEKDEYPYPKEAIDMTYDGLHPSDKGNAVISNMLVDIMKKY